MDHADIKQNEKKSRSRLKKKTMLARSVDVSTAKLLSEITAEINKKSLGRRIKDFEVIAAGVRLIGDRDIKRLQDASLSEKDRVDLAYKVAITKEPKLSFDQFLGRLLRGETRVEEVGSTKINNNL